MHKQLKQLTTGLLVSTLILLGVAVVGPSGLGPLGTQKAAAYTVKCTTQTYTVVWSHAGIYDQYGNVVASLSYGNHIVGCTKNYAVYQNGMVLVPVFYGGYNAFQGMRIDAIQ